MTYSRKQLKFRFVRGILFGLLIGVMLVFGTKPFWSKLPFIGDGSAAKDQVSKAGKQAQELRKKAARDDGKLDEDELKKIAAGEAEEAEALKNGDANQKEEDPKDTNKETSGEDASGAVGGPDGSDTPSSGPRRVYEDASAGYAVTLPSGWISESSGGQVQLKPAGAKSSPDGDLDVPDGLLVRTRVKASGAPLKDVYNGKTAPNYYTDAAGGSSDGTVNGRPSVTFRGVAGYESTTITVVDLGDTVVEIHDPGERRQSDGTFAQVVSSFQVK